MTILGILATAVAAIVVTVLLLPMLVDVVSMARMQPTPLRPPRAPSTRFLFLIPAHDEAGQIASTVSSVLALDYPAELVRVVVIADNCTDDTASVARGAGAECLERHDLARMGKPYAIAWALDQLADGRHDAVVVLDADAVVDPAYALTLNDAAPLRNKAIECFDDVRNPSASALTRMAAVLSAGRFRGSFALKQRAGLTVPLSDGLCIGADLLRRRPWSAFGICEDWELYAQLTAAGERIELVPGAHLYALETDSLRQARTQRHRWLSGKLGVLWSEGPGLLRSPHIGWHQKLDTLSELAVPGPAVHLGLVAGLAPALIGLGAPVAAPLAWALAFSLARPALYAAIGVAFVPERARAIAAFTYLPIYTCWRLVVAAASVWPARQRLWIRTARE